MSAQSILQHRPKKLSLTLFLVTLVVAIVTWRGLLWNQANSMGNGAHSTSDLNSVASLALQSDEIIWALLPPDQRHRIKGLSSLAIDPLYSCISEEIGGVPLISADPESLVAAQAQLYLLSPFHSESFLRKAKALNLNIKIFDPARSIADIEAHIRDIATLLNLPQQGEALISELNQTLHTANDSPKSIPALLFSSDGIYPGQGTLMDELFQWAGLQNLAAGYLQDQWGRIDAEALARLNPELLVVPASVGSKDQVIAMLYQKPYSQRWRATLDQNLVFVPDAVLFSTSHHLTVAIQQIRAHQQPSSLKTEKQNADSQPY